MPGAIVFLITNAEIRAVPVISTESSDGNEGTYSLFALIALRAEWDKAITGASAMALETKSRGAIF